MSDRFHRNFTEGNTTGTILTSEFSMNSHYVLKVAIKHIHVLSNCHNDYSIHVFDILPIRGTVSGNKNVQRLLQQCIKNNDCYII